MNIPVTIEVLGQKHVIYINLPDAKVEVLPDYWIMRRFRNQHGNFDCASRLDGVNVGRNGYWVYCTDPGGGQGLVHNCPSDSCESTCLMVDVQFPLKPYRFPFIAWYEALEGPLKGQTMVHILVYGIEKVSDGLYNIDGCLMTSKKTWGTRQNYTGTLSRIFEYGKQLGSVPADTIDYLNGTKIVLR